MDTDDLLTAEQAAEILGITPGTVRGAMQEGRIPVVSLYGRRLLKREDVLAYKARTQPEGGKPKGRPKGVKDTTPRTRAKRKEEIKPLSTTEALS